MFTKKAKRNAIFALAATLVCSVVCTINLPVKTIVAEENDPIFVYDFSDNTLPKDYDKTAANATGVKITAAKGSAEATLYSGTTNSKPDAYIDSGKLVFNQSGVDDTNGYFVLSETALKNLAGWTLSMKISDMKVGNAGSYNLLSISQKSTVETTIGKDNQGILLHNTQENGVYKLYLEKTEPGWVCNSTANASFYFDDGILDIVYDGDTVSAYISGHKALSVVVGENYFADKSFIKIGGYILSWGRNATICSFDDIALYGYALSDAEIKANYDKEYPVTYSAEKSAEIYYDFSSAGEDGTVENIGAADGMNGRIVAKTVNGVNDVRVEKGSLVINNDGSSVSKDAGYFRLPDEMFAGKTEWTIQMTVSSVKAENQNGIIGFFEKDPAEVPIAEDVNIAASERFDADGKAKNSTSHVFWFFNNNVKAWTMYAQTSYGDDASGKSWNMGDVNPFKKEPKVLTIVYKKGVLVGYCDERVVFATQTAGLTENFYEKYRFNKIGGYQFSWGRSATQMTIDDFAFYGYALNVGERVAESEAIVSAVADIGANATEIKATGTTRNGKLRVLTVADVSGVDVTALGEKEYILYFEGQYSPVKTRVLVRNIKDYKGSLTVDTTDVLPAALTVEYTDGNSGEASVVWENYTFKSGEQTVIGEITDAAGRKATATLTVTGVGFEWSKAEELLDSIDAEEETSVKSTFTAMKAALADKIAALKAFENDKANEGVTSAYTALLTAYEAEKKNLISIEPINEAIEKYSADLNQIAEKYKEAYQNAYEALKKCKEECESVAARDKAIEDLRAAANELYLSFEYAGIAGATKTESGETEIMFDSQPDPNWGTVAFSNKISGNYYAEYTVNEPMDYIAGAGANVDVVIKTANRYVTYRVLKNVTWDADCITRCFNANEWKINATSVAVDGEYPENENGGAVWSADKFDMLQPYTVRVYRQAENDVTALYYFELVQDDKICHAFYDRLEDLTDVNIGFSAVNCSVTLENVKIKGNAKLFTAAKDAEYYLADGTAVTATENVYSLEAGSVLYSGSTVSADDQLYSFDVTLNSESATEGQLSFGFAQKNGIVYNRVILTFAGTTADGTAASVLHTPVYGIEVGLFESSKAGSKEYFGTLETGKTYKFAVVSSKAGEDKRSVKVYVLEGDEIKLESEGVTLYFGYDVIPVVSSLSGNFAISKVEAKDLAGTISFDEIIETNYSTESVEKYREAISKIDLSVVTLIKASEQELEQIKNKINEAKSLLKLTKISEQVDVFQKITVKQNAKKVVLPSRVKVKLDNGLTKNLSVTWETVDTTKAGDVEVKGTIVQPDGTEYYVYYPITIKAVEEEKSGGCNGVIGSNIMILAASVFVAGAVAVVKKRKEN